MLDSPDVDRACASSSMSSDTAAAVNDFVVLAVKKSVSGVTGSFGMDPKP